MEANGHNITSGGDPSNEDPQKSDGEFTPPQISEDNNAIKQEDGKTIRFTEISETREVSIAGFMHSEVTISDTRWSGNMDIETINKGHNQMKDITTHDTRKTVREEKKEFREHHIHKVVDHSSTSVVMEKSVSVGQMRNVVDYSENTTMEKGKSDLPATNGKMISTASLHRVTSKSESTTVIATEEVKRSSISMNENIEAQWDMPRQIIYGKPEGMYPNCKFSKFE